MAFWGVEVRPGRPFTHRYNDSKGRLHISMASLGLGSGVEKSLLQINVGDKRPIIGCCLRPDKSDSIQLHLEFEEDDDVVFSVIGPRSINLSGYYMNGIHYRHLREKSESYGEDIGDTDTQRSEPGDEDKYEDDFINDDDPGTFSPSHLSLNGEEYLNDKKLKQGKGKRLRKAYQISESGDEECSQPKKKSTNNSALASVDVAKPSISSNLKTGMSEEKGLHNEDEDGEKAIEQTSNKKAKNNGNCGIESIPNDDDIIVADQPLRLVDSLLPSEGDHMVEDGIPNSDNIELTLANDDATKESIVEKKTEETNEEICEVPENEEVKANDFKMPTLPMDENKTFSIDSKSISSQDQTLHNGLLIEVLKSGKPNGRVAVSGTKLWVRYVGKLKNTGEVIDSEYVKKCYKFHLGLRTEIDGWEVGIEGMRVGEKRRLTIPPIMGYGGEGDGKNIPPGSWLVYEVKLLKVR